MLKLGLGSKNASSPCVASSSRFQKKTNFKPKPAQIRQNRPVPPPLCKTFVRATKSDNEQLLHQTNANFVAQQQNVYKKGEIKG